MSGRITTNYFNIIFFFQHSLIYQKSISRRILSYNLHYQNPFYIHHTKPYQQSHFQSSKSPHPTASKSPLKKRPQSYIYTYWLVPCDSAERACRDVVAPPLLQAMHLRQLFEARAGLLQPALDVGSVTADDKECQQVIDVAARELERLDLGKLAVARLRRDEGAQRAERRVHAVEGHIRGALYVYWVSFQIFEIRKECVMLGCSCIGYIHFLARVGGVYAWREIDKKKKKKAIVLKWSIIDGISFL